MNKTWQVLQEIKEAFKPVELSYVIEEMDGEGAAVQVSIPMKSPRFLIKTVRVIPTQETNVELHILNRANKEEAHIIYFNTTEYSTGNYVDGIYDNVDIPYEDKDGNAHFHFEIINPGSVPSGFTIEVTGLTVR
ncbi:hypothetical protein SAMN05720606_11221 [Paenibacillus polysaccharolyticus]|uniref:Uncharacterized protein n=1 Tax=Paenibacillus polysaccharolyticus TaxID=582692 RepID=A0A1G5JTN0_9BACL|nr:hypothetical protein [Paenibacillus polysaccharolyticus]SCY91745.1 hypothetical protein SAMN05720606_11221 [Paenibacillus polysaccharolyticus]